MCGLPGCGAPWGHHSRGCTPFEKELGPLSAALTVGYNVFLFFDCHLLRVHVTCMCVCVPMCAYVCHLHFVIESSMEPGAH